MKKKSLTQLLEIRYPIIMAPMFLVTNTQMMIEALNSNIAACIPALNYRTNNQLKQGIQKIRSETTTKGGGTGMLAVWDLWCASPIT